METDRTHPSTTRNTLHHEASHRPEKQRPEDDPSTASIGREVLSMSDVVSMTSLSKPQLYRMIDQQKFPRPIQLSARRIGWRRQTVLDWLHTISGEHRSEMT